MPFETREVHMQSLADRVREAREQARLTQAEAASAIRIRQTLLAALETGERASLPPAVYIRGLLRSLGRLYGTDEKELLELFEREHRPGKKPEGLKSIRNIFRPSTFSVTPKKILVASLFALLLGSIAYLGLQIYSLSQPPALTLTEPSADLSQKSGLLLVRGVTEEGAQLKINGETVFVDAEGNFQKELLLLPGLHVLQVNARNVFGRESTVTRTILITAE